MKSKKIVLKLVLDAVMFVLLMLMYSKNVVSLTFHEACGLVVLGIMLVHLLINGTWVKAVTGQLFSGKVPVKTKIGWTVDFLLLVCTVMMTITSLLISKKLFPSIGTHAALIPVHFFLGAVFLVLVGVHCGLHFRFIASVVAGAGRKTGRGVRAAIIAAALAAAAFGITSMAVSSFPVWLSAPFNTAGAARHGSGLHAGGNSLNAAAGAGEQNKSRGSGGSEVQQSSDGASKPVSAGSGRHIQQPLSAGGVLLLAARMMSVTMVFALAAFALESAVSRRRRRESAQENGR